MMDRREHDCIGGVSEDMRIDYEKVKLLEYIKFRISEMDCAKVNTWYKIAHVDPDEKPKGLLFTVFVERGDETNRYKYSYYIEKDELKCSSDNPDRDSVIQNALWRIIDKFAVEKKEERG